MISRKGNKIYCTALHLSIQKPFNDKMIAISYKFTMFSMHFKIEKNISVDLLKEKD